jgi:hypothetical protein
MLYQPGTKNATVFAKIDINTVAHELNSES